MNRREFLGATIVSSAIMVLPTTAFGDVARDRRVSFSAMAIENPHAQLAADWIDHHLRAGVIYCRDDMFGTSVKLIDPRFRVIAGRPVWNWMTGDTDEIGLTIHVEEMGVKLGHTLVATSKGYEDYFVSERDMEQFPDYFVRNMWLPYDHQKVIEKQLPAGHINVDTRWLSTYIEREKAA